MPDFKIVDDNLRTAMRFFGNATGTGEIQHLAGAGHRAAGAPAGHEVVEALAGEIQQDFRAGGLAVVGRNGAALSKPDHRQAAGTGCATESGATCNPDALQPLYEPPPGARITPLARAV